MFASFVPLFFWFLAEIFAAAHPRRNKMLTHTCNILLMLLVYAALHAYNRASKVFTRLDSNAISINGYNQRATIDSNHFSWIGTNNYDSSL